MLMLGNLSIAGKLTAMNMLVSGTALVIACLAFIAYDVFSFRQSMVHNLSIQAQMAGSNSISPLLFNDTKAAENTLSALKAARSIVSAGIYTSGGSPFATYWRGGDHRKFQPPQNPPGPTRGHLFYDGRPPTVPPLCLPGKPTGHVFHPFDLPRNSAP